MTTTATASREWHWKYFVDLLAEETFSRVRIHFGKDGYPTHFIVRARTENGPWKILKEDKNCQRTTVEIKVDQQKARFIEVESVKPDSPKQKGNCMAIAELEVLK